MLHRCFPFFIVILVLLTSGCVFFKSPQPSSQEIVDPLIESNRQWRENVDAGNAAIKEGQLQNALTAFYAAIKVRPNSSLPYYKIAEIYLQLDEYEKARDAFYEFIELEPNHITALNYVGFIFEQLNDYKNAVKYYERVLTISEDDLYALNHLGLAFMQLNRLDDAETVLLRALTLDPKCESPASETLHNYLGLVYLMRGEVGEAIAHLRESIRIFPNDIWARQRLASVYEDNQRYFEAQLQYQKLLEVDPDNLFAKTRLQKLAQLSPTPTTTISVPPVSIIEIDVDQIIADAPTSEDYPDADVLILFNHFSHDVLPSGRSRYTTHQVVKILNERGIQKYGDIAIPYQPNTQNIGVNIARTIGVDGSEHIPPDEAFNDVTPPGLLSYNLYSDMMWRVISMVGLSPGVCIEYQVTLEDKLEQVTGNKTWITGGYNFQSSEVTLGTVFALRLPQDYPIQWKTDNFAIEPEVTYDANGIVSYIWRKGEVPALKLEERMPHINDIAMRLRYSSIASWHDVYKWYKDLAKGRYVPDEHIQHAVEQLIENLKSDNDIIRDIYHFVSKRIRYVGIELGQSAYQPSAATEVLQKQYGDCKDKTTLLISMLDLVGIKAYPVMVSTAPYERVNRTLPSLSQFNHMIAAIPMDKKKYIWMDPTSNTCSYGDLPYRNQGRVGFLIGDTDGTFVDIPVFPAESNKLVSKTELWLNSDGRTRGEIHLHLTGQYNLNSRWTYKQIAPPELKNTLAAELNPLFPNVVIDDATISDLSDSDLPFEMSIDFHIAKYLRKLDDQALLQMPIDEFSDYAEIVGASERLYPLDLYYPMQIEKSIQIHLPDGWSTVLPADIKKETSFATLNRQYRQDKNIVHYQLIFTLRQQTIPTVKYPEAKRFFNLLANEDGSSLLLETKNVKISNLRY